MPRPLALLALLAAPLALAQGVPEWAAPMAPPAAASSAPDDPGGTPGTPGDPGPATVPLDGGLGLLALAGGAYAARRLRQRD